MRVLMISDHADPMARIGSKEAGGQNIYVYNLALNLSRQKIYVDVFTRWDKKQKKEIVYINDYFRVIRVKAGPKSFFPKEEFVKYLEEFSENILDLVGQANTKYDLVHTNYWMSGLAGLAISKKLKVPQAHVYHSLGQLKLEAARKINKDNLNKSLADRILAEAKIANETDFIISTSPVEARYIKKIFQVASKKIKVIPIGVNLKQFYPLKYARKKRLLLYVGRIEWRKGLRTLITALGFVVKTVPDIKLLIIGGGKTAGAKRLEKQELDAEAVLIKKYGLEKNVIYAGPKSQKELLYYYNLAEMSIVPSYYEPFGIVPVESMACGTPVIASETGGLRYTVKDKVTGYLVKPGDSNRLAKRILLLLSEGKGKFFINCLNRVRTNFSWEEICLKYIDFFKEMKKEYEYENSYASSLRGNGTTSKIWWNGTSGLQPYRGIHKNRT